MVPVSNSRSARSCCLPSRACWSSRSPPPTTSGASAAISYPLKARFSTIGQLRVAAPVKIGGVVVGSVSDISLDPQRFDSIVTLSIDGRYKDLPADTSAGIFTSGLLGESYVGLAPGGDVEILKPGDEITLTQSAVDLMQLVGKYMFSGGAPAAGAAPAAPSTSAPPRKPPHEAKPDRRPRVAARPAPPGARCLRPRRRARRGRAFDGARAGRRQAGRRRLPRRASRASSC